MLRSSVLHRHGFRHGFATRVGGVSEPPFDTLNLGYHLGDEDAAVRENRARFAEALGIPLDRLYEQRQVHGNHVREIGDSDLSTTIANAEGDALVTRRSGVGVAARTADCVPVLIAHAPSGEVCAVHAGWRGAVARVVPSAIAALSHDPSELVAAIGPHIRDNAFEVGEDVAFELERAAGGRPVVDRDHAKPRGRLEALIRFQLLDAGLREDAIDDVGGCTHTDVTRFFSHRRDHGRTGRHLSVIVARGSS